VIQDGRSKDFEMNSSKHPPALICSKFLQESNSDFLLLVKGKVVHMLNQAPCHEYILCLTKHHDIRCMGEWMYSSTYL